MILELTQRIAELLYCDRCYYNSITDEEHKDFFFESKTKHFSDSYSSQNNRNDDACSDDKVEVEIAKKSKKESLISQLILKTCQQQKIQEKILKNRVYEEIRKKTESSSRYTKVAIQRTVIKTKQSILTHFFHLPRKNKCYLEHTRQEMRHDQEIIAPDICTQREGVACSTILVGNSFSSTSSIDKHWSKKRIHFSNKCTLNVKRDEGSKIHSWNPTNAQIFSVRAGPQYHKNKNKLASKPSLYEVSSVRCFSSNQRTNHVADLFPLSSLLPGDEQPLAVFPQVLIVHFQLPHETPNLFRSKDDGIGSEMIFYLRPSSRFLNEIQNPSSSSPATKLFQKFAQSCTTSSDMRGRFKCLALIKNLQEELKNLSSWLQPYNGKPVLVSDTAEAREGVSPEGIRYLEFSVNVHAWTFMAKKGFTTLLPYFKRLKLNVGFVIEGVTDDELPECVLGCVELNFMDVEKLICIPNELQNRELN